ncbi:MAG: hypothetical protein ACYTEG_06555 [Planctomycetota bacterium]|jgi:hypothetical protein
MDHQVDLERFVDIESPPHNPEELAVDRIEVIYRDDPDASLAAELAIAEFARVDWGDESDHEHCTLCGSAICAEPFNYNNSFNVGFHNGHQTWLCPPCYHRLLSAGQSRE